MGILGNYIHAPEGGETVKIRESRWIVGLLVLVLFAPGLFVLPFPPRDVLSALGWGIVGFAVGTGFLCLIYFRKSLFDRSSGAFTCRLGFLFPVSVFRGQLGDIQAVILDTSRRKGSVPTSRGRSRRATFYFSTLMVECQGKRIVLARDGPAADPTGARRLAVCIGCTVKFTGENRYWDELGSGKYYEEKVEEARAKLKPPERS